jgi:hypothetical protein
LVWVLCGHKTRWSGTSPARGYVLQEGDRVSATPTKIQGAAFPFLTMAQTAIQNHVSLPVADV